MAFLIYTLAATAQTATVGPPEVVDGETVRVSGKAFRLYGIDAPDIAQTCEIRDRKYNCGRVSMTALMDLVAGVNIRCVPRRGATGTPVMANCYATGYDLSEGMVAYRLGARDAARRDKIRPHRSPSEERQARLVEW